MSSSHWCHRCNRFVRIWRRQGIPVCPDCDSGFVEEVENHTNSRRRRVPPAAVTMHHRSDQNSRPNHRWNCRNFSGERSQFNPVIMLRRGESSTSRGGFEFFYDDGSGSGLRPLPQRMSEILLGSGFDRVMEQLYHVETGRHGHHHHSHHQNFPASKAAVDSWPEIEINESHISTESHCAVCKEPFEIGIAVKEMPCKHVYHSDCILPWLAIRNSCPVCRQELPSESNAAALVDQDQVPEGLTIWRLPGGGFMVGTYAGGSRGGTWRELPVVFTEVDGGFNNGVEVEPRRVSWSLSSSRRRGNGGDGGGSGGGGLRRMLNTMFRCLRNGVRTRRAVSSVPAREDSSSRVPVTVRSNSVSRANVEPSIPSPRSRRTWSMDVNSGTRAW
ncbi:E3 ubiquitin-protein ligase RDUF2-like [Lotus japonicus]|uniref:E3 ubiquitin-protein ligase RDUF2-like n=1 Tax=Lotus japonicus TaxID=34305 RepID=UPI00258F2F08|nr:E3 ubiquitin-protein ligase RDUF2-like [Lotus japonicus]